MITLLWMDKRGAGHGRTLPPNEDAITAALGKLRCHARLDKDGETIGGVEYCDIADDRRIKWQWWFDREAVRGAAQ